MPYPGAHTYPGARTLPGLVSDPYVVDGAPPASTVDDLLAGSRRLTRRVRLQRAGREVAVLPCSGGQITVRDGLPTREISGLAVHGTEWVPARESDLLHPEAGCEVHVEAMLTHRDVGELRWDLGVFDLRVGKVSLSDSGDGVQVSISAPDRSTSASRGLMLAPAKVAAGRPSELAVADVLASLGSTLPVEPVGVGGLCEAALSVGEPGKDPIAALVDAVLKPHGVDLRVGPDGVARLVPVRDPASSPPRWVWRVGDHPVFEVGRELSARTKAVIVPWQGLQPRDTDGNATGPAPSGIEVVPDVWSTPRAWWDGDKSAITSPAQARAAGEAWLVKEQSGADLPSLKVLLDPRVQVGDIARVEHAELGIAMTARVVGLSIDLEGDVMDVTLAGRRWEDD